jgi:hypothetical protein
MEGHILPTYPTPPDELGIPCRWEKDNGECVLDGLGCEICENYEPKHNGGSIR